MGFVPDSSLVYHANGGVRLWDSATNTKKGKVIPHAGGPAESWGAYFAPAINPEGKAIVTAPTRNSIRFWDLQSQQPTSAEFQYEDSVTDLHFTPDGRWLFSKCQGQWTVRDAADPKAVAGPFPDDVRLKAVYSPETQQLATFKNNDEKEKSWHCDVVIRAPSGNKWVVEHRARLPDHLDKSLAAWIDDKHPLVAGSPRIKRHQLSELHVISFAAQEPKIKSFLFRGLVADIAVAPDQKHFLTSGYRSTVCWKLGQKEPVWEVGTSEPGRRHHMFLGKDWVLLHEKGQTTGARPAIVRSLKNGNELWRKEGVIAADANGLAICFVDATGVEVWQGEDGWVKTQSTVGRTNSPYISTSR